MFTGEVLHYNNADLISKYAKRNRICSPEVSTKCLFLKAKKKNSGKIPMLFIWNAVYKGKKTSAFFWICGSNRCGSAQQRPFLNLCFGLAAEFATGSIVCCLVVASFFTPERRHVMSPPYNENVSLHKEEGDCRSEEEFFRPLSCCQTSSCCASDICKYLQGPC